MKWRKINGYLSFYACFLAFSEYISFMREEYFWELFTFVRAVFSEWE